MLFVWLSEGFVKSDIWIWLVEAQESEVEKLWFLETHIIKVNNGVKDFGIRFVM